MQIYFFTEQGVQQGELTDLPQWQEFPKGALCVVADYHDNAVLKTVLSDLDVHPLAIQDLLRDRHPPKYEIFPSYALCLVRALPSLDRQWQFQPLHMGVIVGDNWIVIRYQRLCPTVDTVLAGMIAKKTVPGMGSLLWEIMGTLGVQYLEWLMVMEGYVSVLEDAMISAGADKKMAEVIVLKTAVRKHRRNFLYLERVAAAMREKGIGKDVLPHSPESNDLYEKWERVHSMAAMFYDQLGDMIDGYISQSSYKLNVTMRVLTVITAIFIPLSFIAALYGMNFDYMPELTYKYAYFVLLVLMAIIGLGMVFWFKRIKWL